MNRFRRAVSASVVAVLLAAVGILTDEASVNACSCADFGPPTIETYAEAASTTAAAGIHPSSSDEPDEDAESRLAAGGDGGSLPVGLIVGLGVTFAVLLFGLRAIRNQRRSGSRKRLPPIG